MNVGLVAAAVSGLATSLGALPFVFVRALPRRAYDGILGPRRRAHARGGDARPAERGRARRARGRRHGLGPPRARRARASSWASRSPPSWTASSRTTTRAATTSTSATSPATTSTTDTHAPERGEARRGYAVVGALTLHRIPEGLAIGAGFAVPGSSHLGLLLAIAVGVQNACEGLVMAAPLRAGGVSGAAGFVIVATTGLAIPAAAVAGRRRSPASPPPRCPSSSRSRAARSSTSRRTRSSPSRTATATKAPPRRRRPRLPGDDGPAGDPALTRSTKPEGLEPLPRRPGGGELRSPEPRGSLGTLSGFPDLTRLCGRAARCRARGAFRRRASGRRDTRRPGVEEVPADALVERRTRAQRVLVVPESVALPHGPKSLPRKQGRQGVSPGDCH